MGKRNGCVAAEASTPLRDKAICESARSGEKLNPAGLAIWACSVILNPNTMHAKALCASLVYASGLAIAVPMFAQAPAVQFPAPSPLCTVKQRVGLTDVEITYSRPSVKGRKVFGGIVPYDQVWRTGANASTKLTFSTPVKLNGVEVPAGTYALYTIPAKKEWTIILSTNLTANIFSYSPTNDFARFKVTPVALPRSVETLAIDLNDIRDDSATFNLFWEKVHVLFKIELDVVSKVVSQIEAAMAAPGQKQAGFYYQAASFYFNHGQDLNKALGWLNTGLEGNPRIAYELLYLKAQILAKQGDKAGATAAAKQSSELAVKAEGLGSSFVKMNADLISSLRR